MSKSKPSLFIERLIAFLVDTLIVVVVSSFISAPFVDFDKVNDYQSRMVNVIYKWQTQEIDDITYLNEYSQLYYDASLVQGSYTFIYIVVTILYFIVYQMNFNGKTIGKRIMGIRLKSNVGELSANQMIARVMFSNFLLVKLLSFAFLIFDFRQNFLYLSLTIDGINYIIILISVILIMNKKKTLAVHDLLCGTRVIKGL